MNEQTKAQVEAYAEECRTEQLELLRTLGKMPAPTRKEDFRAAFCRDWLRAQGAETTPSVASTGHRPLVCDPSKA